MNERNDDDDDDDKTRCLPKFSTVCKQLRVAMFQLQGNIFQ